MKRAWVSLCEDKGVSHRNEALYCAFDLGSVQVGPPVSACELRPLLLTYEASSTKQVVGRSNLIAVHVN